MAVGIDKTVKNRLGRHPNILWRRYTSFLRAPFRSAQQRFQKNLPVDLEDDESFEFSISAMQKQHFSENNWLYIENFAPHHLHKAIKENWPRSIWFDPLRIRNKTKTYDSGFPVKYPKLDQFSVSNIDLLRIYRFLASEKLSKALTELCSDFIPRTCYWLLANSSYWGSGLAPHRDTPSTDSNGEDQRVNIIYFVHANGEGWDGGGTSILSDNTFKNPIFIPKNLSNSALIYRTGSSFFHGFPPMKFKKFRHVVTAHFQPIQTN